MTHLHTHTRFAGFHSHMQLSCGQACLHAPHVLLMHLVLPVAAVVCRLSQLTSGVAHDTVGKAHVTGVMSFALIPMLSTRWYLRLSKLCGVVSLVFYSSELERHVTVELVSSSIFSCV